MAVRGKMLKNGRSDATRGLHMHGCSCCNSKAKRRAAKKGAKAKEKAGWKKDAAYA